MLVGVIFILLYCLHRAYGTEANQEKKPLFFEDLIKGNVKREINPCEDFYEYACGNDEIGYLGKLDEETLNIVFEQMFAKNYINERSIKPLQQVKIVYEKCIDYYSNSTNGDSDPSTAINESEVKNQVNHSVNEFSQLIGAGFPTFDPNYVEKKFSPKTLAKALAHLDGTQGCLICHKIDSDSRFGGEIGERRYLLYIGSFSLSYATYYFRNTKIWNHYRLEFLDSVYKRFQQLNAYLDHSVNDGVLFEAAQSLVEFEKRLAFDFAVDIVEENDYLKSYNPYTISSAQNDFPCIDWTIYTNGIFANAPDYIKSITVKNDTWTFIVSYPQILKKICNAITLSEANPSLNTTDLLNWMYFKLATTNEFVLENKHQKSLSTEYAKKKCNDEICEFLMPDACGRVFVDGVLPDIASRTVYKEGANEIVQAVFDAARQMVSEQTWMTDESKQAAAIKISKMGRNVLYYDYILNDTALIEIYKNVHFSPDDDYLTIKHVFIGNDKWLSELEYLAPNATGRKPKYPNTYIPWINSEYNSQWNYMLTPLAIWRPHLYDPNQPIAVNFGAIGLVVGHELMHGFDLYGIQFDYKGDLNPVLDVESFIPYRKAVNCFIEEYDNICPFGNDQLCLDGAGTIFENMADNGGIKAAYYAYKMSAAKMDTKRIKKSNILSEYSDDQLFWLAFQQSWCGTKPKTPEKLFHIKGHSPDVYRPQGAIENNPAFRAAFKCPLNETYTPELHCNLWTLF